MKQNIANTTVGKSIRTVSNFTAKEGVINYSTDINYWDEITGKYRIFSGKNKISVYRDTDLITLFGRDKYDDLGRLFVLINSMDNNNMLGVYDMHKRCYYPITSKQMLYKMLGIKSRATGATFYKKLKDLDIIKAWHNDEGKTVYYINPVYTMADRGITLTVYKLFFDTLNKVLPYKAKVSLQALCSNPSADNSQVVKYNIDTDIVTVDDKTYDPTKGIAAVSDKDKQNIFDEYILHDKPAKTYQLINGSMIAHKPTDDADTYFAVNAINCYKPTKPATTDIIGYNAWYIDIDAGRDNDNKYFRLDEVEKRKTAMMMVISCLPTPTCIISTRNGYHVYWGCYGVTDRAQWQDLEDRIIDLVPIADKAVRDPARLLRLPCTNWCKDPARMYKVEITAANKQAWDVESITECLDEMTADIKKATTDYLSIYPVPIKSTGSTANKVKITAEQTDRIKAIAALSTNTFVIPQASSGSNILDVIHKFSIAEFLQIENPSSFCCVLHDDKHPSATIYSNTDGYSRYYCGSSNCIGHGDGHGLDIIDIVMALANCSYMVAINYLSKIYNIKKSFIAA